MMIVPVLNVTSVMLIPSQIKGRREEDQGGEALPANRVRARRRHAQLRPGHRGESVLR